MLTFGLSLGKTSAVNACTGPLELWENPDFDCGLKGWNPNHNDTELVDNGDGTVTVSNKGSWAYASLMPDNVSIEPGEYVLTLNVKDIVGPGKASYRVGTSWTDVVHYDTTGTHETVFTLTRTTDNWSIGASGDENAVITYDRVSLKPLVEPDWWNIPGLDPEDYVAYDFGWIGHENIDQAMTDFVHGATMSVETGSPTFERGKGIRFDGDDTIGFPIPDGRIDTNLSFVIQFEAASRKGALDAYLGWFSNDGSRFILQQSFDNNHVRWSAGGGSDTVEVNPVLTEGVIGASGPRLYINGEYKGESTNGTPTATSGNKVIFGAAQINGSIQQYSKYTIKKFIGLNAILTDEQHRWLMERMNG